MKFGAQLDADDDWHVNIETGSRISMWRPFVFHTGSSYNSAVVSDIITKCGFSDSHEIG